MGGINRGQNVHNITCSTRIRSQEETKNQRYTRWDELAGGVTWQARTTVWTAGSARSGHVIRADNYLVV